MRQVLCRFIFTAFFAVVCTSLKAANSNVIGNKDDEVPTRRNVQAEPEIIDSGTCGENLTWTLTDDGVLEISGTGDMDKYGIWGSPWYSYKSHITTVVVNDGVTSVGSYAFEACENVTTINIPNSVNKIGQGAFRECTVLEAIDIPYGVMEIADMAFYECNCLASVNIPTSVSSIGSYAFYGCKSLSYIKIPESVTRIPSNSFGRCYFTADRFENDGHSLSLIQDGDAIICDRETIDGLWR